MIGNCYFNDFNPVHYFCYHPFEWERTSFIAGYNTMSDSEKAQYDEEALCKFMGKMMYGISFSIILIAVSEMLENQVLFIIGLTLLLTTIIFTFVYSQYKRSI